jgi:hypothetical protein
VEGDGEGLISPNTPCRGPAPSIHSESLPRSESDVWSDVGWSDRWARSLNPWREDLGTVEGWETSRAYALSPSGLTVPDFV